MPVCSTCSSHNWRLSMSRLFVTKWTKKTSTWLWMINRFHICVLAVPKPFDNSRHWPPTAGSAARPHYTWTESGSCWALNNRVGVTNMRQHSTNVFAWLYFWTRDRRYHYGLRPHPFYKVLKSTLSERCFSVQYNEERSENKYMGPLDSVLGPTRFYSVLIQNAASAYDHWCSRYIDIRSLSEKWLKQNQDNLLLRINFHIKFNYILCTIYLTVIVNENDDFWHSKSF